MSTKRDISDILAECLDAIETQQATVESCLTKYPDQHEALSELLVLREVLEDVSNAPAALPSAEFRTNARASLLNKLEPRQAPTTPRPIRTAQPRRAGWLNLFRSGIGRIVLTSVLVIALLTSVTGGTIYASERALPGGTLYSVKTGIEQYRLSRAESDNEIVNLQLMFAERRIGEIEQLVELGEEQLLESTSDAYATMLRSVAERVNNIEADATRETLSVSLQQAIDFHQPRLREVNTTVDDLAEQGMFSAESRALNTATAAVESVQTYVETGLLVDPAAEPISIFETIDSVDLYDGFTQLLIESELEMLLTENEPFTLFVPLDAYEAFTSMEEYKLRRQRVLYHIGRGALTVDQLYEADQLLMALGNNIDITIVDDEIILNGSVRIVASDIAAVNGIIHFIDAPLTPPFYYP